MYAWKTFKEILKLYHNFNPSPNFTGNTFIQHIIARVLYCIIFFSFQKCIVLYCIKNPPRVLYCIAFFFLSKMYCIVLTFWFWKINVLYCINFLVLKKLMDCIVPFKNQNKKYCIVLNPFDLKKMVIVIDRTFKIFFCSVLIVNVHSHIKGS